MNRHSIKHWLDPKFISGIFCLRENLRKVISLCSLCRQNSLTWQIWTDLPKTYCQQVILKKFMISMLMKNEVKRKF